MKPMKPGEFLRRTSERILPATLMAMVLLATPADAAPFAYVANTSANSISVIDCATNTVTATIPVGQSPGIIALTPDGMFAYVTNSQSGTVSSMHTATNTVLTTIPVGQSPGIIALTPDGMFAYVVNSGVDQFGTVSVV